MTLKRQDIRNQAIGMGRLYVEDVVRVSRDGCVVTQRHSWAEDEDGRVLHAVGEASRRAAREAARRCGKPVTIYARAGWVVDQIDPE